MVASMKRNQGEKEDLLFTACSLVLFEYFLHKLVLNFLKKLYESPIARKQKTTTKQLPSPPKKPTKKPRMSVTCIKAEW